MLTLFNTHYTAAPMLFSSIAVITALLLDQLLGEPRRFHPLVGFGKLAMYLEQTFNRNDQSLNRLRGLLAALVLLLTPAVFAYLIYVNLPELGQLVMASILLYVGIARRSLFEHARDVAGAAGQTLAEAKVAVARIVSRDTEAMTQTDVNRAVIESTLENGSDSIFAPLFWFLIFGVAGLVFYRCANTLDAMWGYRNPRFKYFGWAAAKIDDVLNYIPARLAALAYCLLGNYRQGRECWQKQAAACASPNGGPVMCAGAGALGIRLGGQAFYHGQLQQRAQMGQGTEPTVADIEHSVALIDRSLAFYLTLMLIITVLLCWPL